MSGFWQSTWDSIVNATETAVDKALYEYSRSSVSDAADAAISTAQTKASNYVELARVATEDVVDKALYEYSRTSFSDSVDSGLAVAQQTLDDAKKAGSEALSRATVLVDVLTRPWVLLTIGGVVVLFVLAPYATFLKRG